MADALRPAPPRALVVREDLAELHEALVGLWRRRATRAVAARGLFAAALSGGRTPEGFLRRLATAPGLPWAATHLFLVDERLVPASSPESNLGLVREALLRRLPAPPAGVHAPQTGGGDAAASAAAYERELRAFFAARGARRATFDLALLGLGEDGHTASLFPGGAALGERRRWVAAVPAAGSRLARVTLTLPALRRARAVWFLVTGAAKREMLPRLLAGDRGLPAARVRPAAGRVVVFADRAAAVGAVAER